MKKQIVVNGVEHTVDIAPAERLLDTLRERLRLTGTKQGCGVGECGTCTVLVAGRPRLSCITLTATTADSEVTTVEGLADTAAGLRRAFAEEGGFQCGFCTPGQVVNTWALVRDNAASATPAGEETLRQEITGNVCRCTGYLGIIRAAQREVDRLTSRTGP
ncbi:(2Fe-2S)-binding protein [Streptomyces sp. NBC_01320]|uniref:(2Fe-2S)-binding protein n=1 Tax=Streptomyces sp. NBC_01320 TaxID=2903824 RepID=UPI002E0FE4A6|nr:(2Fe-2S)-binding protein [Streptomyces sp. NBC_01320]